VHAIPRTFGLSPNRNPCRENGLDSEEARNLEGEEDCTARTPAAPEARANPRRAAHLAQNKPPRQPGGRPRRPGAEHRADGDAARPLTRRPRPRGACSATDERPRPGGAFSCKRGAGNPRDLTAEVASGKPTPLSKVCPHTEGHNRREEGCPRAPWFGRRKLRLCAGERAARPPTLLGGAACVRRRDLDRLTKGYPWAVAGGWTVKRRPGLRATEHSKSWKNGPPWALRRS
jgi:hypothetical protein